jgi:hypothetical protein
MNSCHDIYEPKPAVDIWGTYVFARSVFSAFHHKQYSFIRGNFKQERIYTYLNETKSSQMQGLS